MIESLLKLIGSTRVEWMDPRLGDVADFTSFQSVSVGLELKLIGST